MSEPDATHQKLAAILAADAAGYSRLMASDEPGTVTALDAARRVFRTQIESHHGRVVDMAGDSVLALFVTATGAVSAALAVQAELESHLTEVPADRSMRFRIGVHLGDVIEKADGSIYGDGVNIAARLQGLARPGGIAVSDALRGAVGHRVAATFEYVGEQQVKNIADPVRTFQVVAQGTGNAAVKGVRRAPAQAAPRTGQWRRWTVGLLAAAVAALVVFGAMVLRGGAQGATEAPLLSLAVLPLKAAGGAPDAPFAEAFTSGLTMALAHSLLGSSIIANTAVAPYGGKSTDPRTVSKDLNVRYLLEGDVARNGGQVVVSLALVEAHRAKLVWSGRMETPAVKVDAWPELPILKAAKAVHLALWDAERRRLASQPVGDADPLEIVFHAWMVDRSTHDGLEKAKALCDKAIRLDPDLPAALICKAGTIFNEIDLAQSASRAQLVEAVDALSRRAVALSASDAMAWRVRSHALQIQHKWEAAFEANATAIQLDPEYAINFGTRALYMIWTGRPEDAFPLLARAADITSNDVGFYQGVACHAYLVLGRYDEAINSCERSASDEEDWEVQLYLAVAYAMNGDTAKAKAARDRAIARKPEATVTWYRASEMHETGNETYWDQYDKHIEPGLRGAGFPET